MSEQEAIIPTITLPPPPADLLKRAMLADGQIDELESKVRDITRVALDKIEPELARLREEIDRVKEIKETLIRQAAIERVYTQDCYILVDRARETRTPRVDVFRQGVPSDVFMQISELTIRLGKADAILGKNRVDAMCDIQRGTPVYEVTRLDDKKYNQTREGPWRSKK